mmetsp:Transcript_10130/g.15315  ORF Transcript_10130/g.15315 Transcript_10130/m.15315 type:complete len:201 (+) Transcript_10130:524-1126(+)
MPTRRVAATPTAMRHKRRTCIVARTVTSSWIGRTSTMNSCTFRRKRGCSTPWTIAFISTRRARGFASAVPRIAPPSTWDMPSFPNVTCSYSTNCVLPQSTCDSDVLGTIGPRLPNVLLLSSTRLSSMEYVMLYCLLLVVVHLRIRRTMWQLCTRRNCRNVDQTLMWWRLEYSMLVMALVILGPFKKCSVIGPNHNGERIP